MNEQYSVSRRTFLRLFGASTLGLCALSRAQGDLLQRLQNQAVADTRVQEASKLHLILTGYTRPDNVGRACARDCQAMGNTLAAAGLGNRLQVHDLTGNNYSGRTVMEFLQQSPSLEEVGPRQVVCFYHSGHGGGLEPGQDDGSHNLALNVGAVNRRVVRLALERRNPYGIIILTDCCSGIAGATASTRGRANRPNAATIRQLFLRRPRLVDVTAARPGTSAASAHAPQLDGHGSESAFTVALLQLLYSPREYSSWADLFPELRRLTLQASFQYHEPFVLGALQERKTVVRGEW